jgi:hypothetical protein
MNSDKIKQMPGFKETEKKLIYDIDFDYIKKMAERMQLNRDKYPVGNWKKPLEVEDLKQALLRHCIEVMNGNYSDEQEFGHLVALGCNAFMIIEQLKQKQNVKINRYTG